MSGTNPKEGVLLPEVEAGQITRLDANLIDLFQAMDAAYTASRMGAIAEQPGNPDGISVEEDGRLTMLMAKGMPWNQLFNRIIGLQPAMSARVRSLVDRYRAAGLTCRIEIPPTVLTDALALAMADAGLYHWAFHATLYAKLPMPVGVTAGNGIEIVEISQSSEHEAFFDTYVAAWNLPVDIRHDAKRRFTRWLGRPGWRLYLATLDGTPSAVATLYLKGHIAYLADAATIEGARGRGCHTALVQQRIEDACRLGATWVVGKANFLSGSFRNMERSGLRLAYTLAVWSDRVG
jgi:hypothetical protein